MQQCIILTCSALHSSKPIREAPYALKSSHIRMRCLHALQVLDVEKDVSAEGVGSFDIIFATNVLHATRNMSNTLLNCKVCSVDHLLSCFCRAVRMHECGLPYAELRRSRPCSCALQLQIR